MKGFYRAINTVALLLMLHVFSTALFADAPTVYGVSGVNAGDVLNVRAEATTQSSDLGDLGVDASPIEVIEYNDTGEWGRILWKDGNAWVSLMYLTPIKTPVIDGTEIPIGLHCGGTEPSWSLTIDSASELSFEQPDTTFASSALIETAVPSSNSASFPTAVIAHDDTLELSALVKPANCNDGSSDREYGWQMDVILQATDTQLLSGCCELPMVDVR